jgi:hypothetical protein
MPQSAPAHVTDFPALKLRPVSTMFSAHFREHILTLDSESEGRDNDNQSPPSSGPGTGPVTPSSFPRSDHSGMGSTIVSSGDPAEVIQALQNQMSSARKAWQLEIRDLEGQVRDLKAEVEDLRAAEKDYCETCGRGKRPVDGQQAGTRNVGVVNRPRARTGASSRFVNGG